MVSQGRTIFLHLSRIDLFIFPNGIWAITRALWVQNFAGNKIGFWWQQGNRFVQPWGKNKFVQTRFTLTVTCLREVIVGPPALTFRRGASYPTHSFQSKYNLKLYEKYFKLDRKNFNILFRSWRTALLWFCNLLDEKQNEWLLHLCTLPRIYCFNMPNGFHFRWVIFFWLWWYKLHFQYNFSILDSILLLVTLSFFTFKNCFHNHDTKL